MTTRVRVGVIGTGALIAFALARAWWAAAAHGEQAPSGVVIITLDTTRADRLSPYGFMNVSLPHLERLAREGVVFDRTSSVAPLTLPAHTSLFTGLLPPNHGVRDNADQPLAESQTTLAEVLRARGFRTGAFVGSVVLNPERGLKQGFEQYRAVDKTAAQTTERRRPANAVVDDAIRWLDTVGESPFFLWTHLYDAHRPYDPPEPYRSLYGHNPYVAEIAFADSQIGRLLNALEQRHALDRTVVVVVGDHGESLGAHGEQDHGIFVYEDVIHVPLIIRAPLLRPSRVAEVVRLVDVMPTVLDLLHIPSPPTDGVSLAGLMSRRGGALNLEAYSESLYPARFGWSPLRALRDGRFKVIDAPHPELYDLDRDPFEERNIYDAQRPVADAMFGRLARLAKGHEPTTAQQRTGATPELRALLGSLGYVSGTVSTRQTNRALPDPKDCIGTRIAAPPARPQPACGPPRPNDENALPVQPPRK
jgi:arylsulfatase A-like enzyme